MTRAVWSILFLLMLMGPGRGCVWAQDDQLARLTMPVVAPSQAASSCPTGTYLFVWNGLYPADTDKGCFTSGTAQKDGAQTGGTLIAGSYTKTANNQYILWVVAADDGFNEEIGTIWVNINITNDGTDSTVQVFESVADANNTIKFQVNSTRTVTVTYVGNATSKSKSSVATVSEGSEQHIAASWDRVSNNFCVKVGANAWECSTPGLTQWTTQPDDVTMGENINGGGENDVCAITGFRITETYQSADPF